MHNFKTIIYCLILKIFILISIFFYWIYTIINVHCPTPDNLSAINLERKKTDENLLILGNNWLKKNNYGLWELYIEGKPFERGVIAGKLTKELIRDQEDAFVRQIDEIVPSKIYQKFLLYFLALFNRNIEKYITTEYLLEIYGISLSASDKYDYIAPKYARLLNYHASHDIGHALQNMHLIGCTSFSVWYEKSSDSSVITGRNFDLYLGDEFARDKIISFINPDSGYKYMSIGWGGMTGIVSGMNETGLTATINASSTEIPTSAKTPISILVREILQYSKNISEAYKIAQKREIFVSENIMISSSEDNKTVIIEKSPEKTGIFIAPGNFIICTNHYQGKTFRNDILNLQNIKESASMYRFQRVKQLLDKYKKLGYTEVAAILRDQKGIDDKNIGMGNEKVVNQLIGHHSIIFKPAEKKVWISTKPWQLGEYLCYDLNKIFSEYPGLQSNINVYEKELTISSDSFMFTADYKKYLQYRELKRKIQSFLTGDNEQISDGLIHEFISTNPENYQVYILAGDYYMFLEKFSKAVKYYKIALTKEIATKQEFIETKKKIKECRNF
ncbi:MAG: peptidase C45 [Bacteroidia bacterium]|nr:peptidase C45 [Bacteroidia bacterium]